jgi:hypothetical protein
MRTSLNKIKNTEDFLLGKLTPEDSLVFKAKLLVDPALRINTGIQHKIYELVRAYGRKQLKSEIESVHVKLFNDPEASSFRRSVYSLFKK